MNRFKEWLSDNLRYLILLAAIALGIAAIVIGVQMYQVFQSDTRSENQRAEELQSGDELRQGDVMILSGQEPESAPASSGADGDETEASDAAQTEGSTEETAETEDDGAERASENESETETESESEQLPVIQILPERESETERVTEPQSESETERVTQPQSESETERVTQPQSESETERVTEPQSESETERVTEPQSESETERVTEPQSESETERVTETHSERETEELPVIRILTETEEDRAGGSEQTTETAAYQVRQPKKITSSGSADGSNGQSAAGTVLVGPGTTQTEKKETETQPQQTDEIRQSDETQQDGETGQTDASRQTEETQKTSESQRETVPETEEIDTLRHMPARTKYAETSANVRSGPGTEYEVISQLDVGDAVSVTGRTANWYEVEIGGEKGFVSQGLIVDEYTPTYLTMTGTCYLRSEADYGDNIIGEYYAGTTVEFLGDVGGWYKVKVDGMVGYMGSRFF